MYLASNKQSATAVFTRNSFARLSHHLGIFLSLILMICIKTVQVDHEIFTVGCPKDSRFSDKILCPCVKVVPLE